MGILSWILFGLVAGAVAKFLTPGDDPGGCLTTILLGIIGSILGGFIASRLGYGEVTRFDFRSFLVAVGGAILLLLGYRILRGRR